MPSGTPRPRAYHVLRQLHVQRARRALYRDLHLGLQCRINSGTQRLLRAGRSVVGYGGWAGCGSWPIARRALRCAGGLEGDTDPSPGLDGPGGNKCSCNKLRRFQDVGRSVQSLNFCSQPDRTVLFARDKLPKTAYRCPYRLVASSKRILQGSIFLRAGTGSLQTVRAPLCHRTVRSVLYELLY